MAKPTPKKISLEQVYRHRDVVATGAPVYIIDFRVALHAILSSCGEYGAVCGIVSPALPKDATDEAKSEAHTSWLNEVAQSSLWLPYLRAQWAMRLNRGPDMLPRVDCRVVVVDDNKLNGRYWRHIDEPAYKGTRSASIHEAYHSIKRVGQQLVAELDMPFYSEPLYEADDWAGVVYRAKLEADHSSIANTRTLFYGTVDSDWLQLVDDATHQLWANTGPWPSRLKNEYETRAYVLKRMGEVITRPSEIALVKQKCGDSADNLSAGSALHLFDLVRPNPLYDLADTAMGKQLGAELYDCRTNTRYDVLRKGAQWLNANGLPVTLRP